MSDDAPEYYRFCPGEEHSKLSDAICLGRRRANFRKCPGCQFNDDEKGNPTYAATVVGQRHLATALQENREEEMIAKVFKAYDVRGTVPEPLTEGVAWRIGNATAQFLRTALMGYERSDSEMNRVVVGRDMRKHSPLLSRALIEGIIATGAHVVDVGMIDTSQLAFAVNHIKCCGGVQTTASHNPSNYNGFKICGQKGKPIGADTGLKEIERIAVAISRQKVDNVQANIQAVDLSQPYRDFLLRFLKPPRPLKIVIDASNGMAGRWFPIVFDGVPNLEIIRLNFEHDGEFVHQPNPLVPANLDQLRAAVREHGADFGACFDGDADRCIFVDEQARILGCDLLTALLAVEFLRDNRGSAVIYDLRSSRVVAEEITKAGGVPKRGRVGHVFMKRMMADNHAVFGGELSGHFYFRDFWNCDSGLLAFIALVNTLTRTQQPLSALLDPLNRYSGSGERNFENDDKSGTLKRLGERYKDGQQDMLDGLTVQYRDWWFNVRASNTEPLLRLNVEAVTPALLGEKLAELTPMLGHSVEH